MTTAGGIGIDAGPSAIVVAQDVAYFDRNDGVHGEELWVTDGTKRHTRMVVDLTPGTAGSRVHPLAALSRNRVLMLATTGDEAQSLWVSDGTAAGTIHLGDALRLGEVVSVGDVAYYTARPTSAPATPFGNAIFKTDGTPAGTVELTRIPPGQGGLWAKSLTTCGSYLIFNNESSMGNGVWRSDGTVRGTLQLIPEAERVRTNGSHSYTPFRRGLFFAAPSGLWGTDGTPAGTRLVKRLAQISWGMTVGADGMLYFFAPRNGKAGGAPALWRSDGTRDGTRPLPDLGIGTDLAVRLTRVDNLLYFRTSGTTSGGATRERLWRTDGTARATLLLDDARDLQAYAPAAPFARSLIFASGARLMSTDGTGAGTAPIAGAPEPVAAPLNSTEIVRLRGMLLFMGRSSGSFHLWRLDPPGTVSGVVFHDADGDGRLDVGEGRLSGFRVFVDDNGNGRFDRDEVWSRTNARGEHTLLGVEAGRRRIAVTAVRGWSRGAEPFKSLAVRSGEATRVHFGQARIG